MGRQARDKSRKYGGRKPDSDKSKYGKKKIWRQKNCDGTPLCFFPEMMSLPSHQKPWATAKAVA